ncbi:MAG: gliding motility lipoprotein GldH [Bacteroidales bacterium]|jgi:gliding motility-associated lipoprotein GldH|nr:gliding motility lipoprotein GldH [Bacteroidales bacterium]MCK9498706.1 gliding motility lipoprotein GldH [Bacteroidales bacterium]MDY0314037.1 gliding motility lipoprotein GldH [Bacteroidales bacterium]NLB86661.1 gliding motility lipoprotein GldH [Bacteroidales bacterium]
MKKTNKKALSLLVLMFFNVFFISCDRNKVYEEYQNIHDKDIPIRHSSEYQYKNLWLFVKSSAPNDIWDNKKKLLFTFEIDDTLTMHNVYIHIRHSSEYQYKNLWLFVKSSAPNGVIKIDTLECNLADDYGKWYGKGSGSIRNLQWPWKMNVRFPHKGKYSVEYEQAMRIDQLPGIMKMGLRIEKVDAK